MEIWGLYSLKGGAGKTAAAVNLVYEAAAAGGIGRAAAARFLQEGARVMLVDLRSEDLNEAAETLGRSEDLFTVTADVSDPDSVANYVAETADTLGGIDVFFNNAGIEGRFAPLTSKPSRISTR